MTDERKPQQSLDEIEAEVARELAGLEEDTEDGAAAADTPASPAETPTSEPAAAPGTPAADTGDEPAADDEEDDGEAPPDVTPETPAAEPAQAAEPAVAEVKVEPIWSEKLEDGTVREFYPDDLKDPAKRAEFEGYRDKAAMRRADYTQKTMELSDARKASEAEAAAYRELAVECATNSRARDYIEEFG